MKAKLYPPEKSIITFIEGNQGTKSGEVASKLQIPNSTNQKDKT